MPRYGDTNFCIAEVRCLYGREFFFAWVWHSLGASAPGEQGQGDSRRFSAHLENHYFFESFDALVFPIPHRWIVLCARIFNFDTGNFRGGGDLFVQVGSNNGTSLYVVCAPAA